MFRNLIPFGNRAEDYYALMHSIDTGRAGEIDDQSGFTRFKSGLSEQTMNDYQKTFYRLRKSYQDEDGRAWSGLLPPFPGIADAVRLLSERFILAIATSKDHRSVSLLLESYGLTGYFSPDLILDKDFAHSKREHMNRLHQLTGLSFPEIHFIDDKVLHLLSVADFGVRCYLACWGFNTVREHAIARANGFRTLTLEDLPGLGTG